jgi:hypothetical protein
LYAYNLGRVLKKKRGQKDYPIIYNSDKNIFMVLLFEIQKDKAKRKYKN